MTAELEREYLAAAMVAPTVLEDHPVTPGCFSTPRTRAVHAAVAALHGAGRPTDPFAVADYLRGEGRLEEAGGPRGVQELLEIEATGVLGIESVASELRRGARQRQLQERLLAAVEHARSGRLEEAQATATEALDMSTGDAPITNIVEAQRAALVAATRTEGATRSGIEALDRVIGHLDPGDLLMIGADTSVGKTTVALAMSHRIASEGVPVGLLSCEDSTEKIGGRMLGYNRHANPRDLRLGALRAHEREIIDRRVQAARPMPWYVADVRGANELEVSEAMIRMRRQHGVVAWFVDYVQTINAARKGHSRRDEIRAIVSRLKSTAARLGGTLILISQVTRPPANERGKPRRPSRHDLKEAGELENMSEYVVLLWNGTTEEVIDGRTTHTECHDTVHASLDKSKVGGAGTRWIMRRNEYGVLLEEGAAPVAPSQGGLWGEECA